MIQVGYNYGRKVSCPICKLNIPDTQQHMFDCVILKITCQELYNCTDVQYEDIYSSDLQKLLNVSKICETVARKRAAIIS